MGIQHAPNSASASNGGGKDSRQLAGQAANLAQQAGQQAEHTTRQAARSPWVQGLARLGFAAKGTVYLVIGWLALMTAVNAGGQTTDPQGAITAIYQHPFGKFLLFVIFIGFVGYAVWKFVCAALDLDMHETGMKDTLKRVGYAIVGVTYLGLALAALRLATQNAAPKGSNATTQDWTARLLAAPGGAALVVLVGLIVLGIAVAMAMEAWKLRFERNFPMGSMNDAERKATRYSGRFGIGALSAVFVIIGIFLIDAALRHDPTKARGLAGALATLSAQPFGPLLLGVVALGLMAYGVYGYVEARYRRMGA